MDHLRIGPGRRRQAQGAVYRALSGPVAAHGEPPMKRLRHLRGEAGASSVELLVFFPLLLLIILLTVQTELCRSEERRVGKV